MTQEEIKKIRTKSILFLLVGIVTFIVSFLISFLWVFSAMAFYVAYENYKEYRELRSKAEEDSPKNS